MAAGDVMIFQNTSCWNLSLEKRTELVHFYPLCLPSSSVLILSAGQAQSKILILPLQSAVISDTPKYCLTFSLDWKHFCGLEIFKLWDHRPSFILTGWTILKQCRWQMTNRCVKGERNQYHIRFTFERETREMSSAPECTIEIFS